MTNWKIGDHKYRGTAVQPTVTVSSNFKSVRANKKTTHFLFKMIYIPQDVSSYGK